MNEQEKTMEIIDETLELAPEDKIEIDWTIVIQVDTKQCKLSEKATNFMPRKPLYNE